MKKKRIYKLAVGFIIMIIIVASSVYVIGRKGKMIEEKKICQAEETEETVAATENANSEETTKALPTIPDTWDQTKVTPVLSEDNIYVPVPKGFTASGAEGEHTVNTGFVIYEGTGEVNDSNAWTESINRNQFVWVPVSNPSRIYERNSTTGKIKARLWNYNATGRSAMTNNNTDTKAEAGVLSYQTYENIKYFSQYNMSGYTKDSLYKELETEYKNTINSIEKYGGFYIGRYETGNVTSAVPVVKRMNSTISSARWYEVYPRMRNISTNPNIQTSMIWGSLWDETLQWLVDTGSKTYEKINDSTSWGNYQNATFEYKTNASGSTTATKNQNSSTKIPTGSTEYTKANNIYDLAGNVWDWTLEGDGLIYRYYRGGCYINDGTINPASGRNTNIPNSSDRYRGFRSHLYIK